MKRTILILAAAWPALVCQAAAQTSPLTLKADRVLDGRGAVLEDTLVVVQGDSIVRVGGPSAGAVHDLSGLTLMPGGIDTHNHFAWHFDPDGKLHDASAEEESQAQRTLYALENAYRTLLAGITTVQSLGSGVDKDVRDFIARGILPGPRILTSLQPITERTGSPEEIRQEVQRLARQGADVIKIFGSASIRVGGTPTLTQEQMDAACGEARRQGLRSAVHAHGPESVRRAVQAGCTVIEHGALLDEETLRLMAQNGLYYDPNIGLIFQNYFDNKAKYLGIGNYTEDGFAQMERAVPRALEVFHQALLTPQLRIVFGTDAVAGAHGRNFEELIYRVEKGGQGPMQAIVSATSLAAESLRLQDLTGAVVPSLQADLIAVQGNPLQDITSLRRVAFVMKGGVICKMPPSH